MACSNSGIGKEDFFNYFLSEPSKSDKDRALSVGSGV